MDFTKIKCISQKCKGLNITMGGAGGQAGGRITLAKVRCPECGLTLMICPMSDKYEYNISATTEEERREERIKKAKEASELELAKTITNINY
jgi:Fe-S-cluster-containing hydrogenase component 2